MKRLGRKGKTVALGLLSISIAGCAAIGNSFLRDVGLYPENSPTIKKDCKPFPENIWGNPALYTALDPEIVLEKPEVKVKRMEVMKGYESFLFEVPYNLKEYIQKYGNTDSTRLSSSRTGMTVLHLRFLERGYRYIGTGSAVRDESSEVHDKSWAVRDKSLDRWYPYTRFGYIDSEKVESTNFFTRLVVPSRVELTSSEVREGMRREMEKPYENSLSLVAKNIVKDKDRAVCLEVNRFRIKEVYGNKVSFIYSIALRRDFIVSSLNTEKGFDRALFMKVFKDSEMLYRMQCLLKEDINDFSSKDAYVKAKPYISVCGDGNKPFFICMEFKDAVCYTAESIKYKDLAEYLHAVVKPYTSTIVSDSQADWFRSLLEGKLQERSQ